MRQKLAILAVIVLLILVLIGLNAATYVQKEKTPDSEMTPNRSTFNSGVTGTQAFYTLLTETGRKVVRWQTATDSLLTETRNKPSTFVLIGPLRKPFTELESKQLLEWTSAGGRLVIIDRQPPDDLTETIVDWKFSFAQHGQNLLFQTDPSDIKQMTADTTATKPVQPSVFTTSVNAIQTSKFASSINFSRSADAIAQVYQTPYHYEADEGAYGDAHSSPTPEPYDFYKGAAPPATADSESQPDSSQDGSVANSVSTAASAPVVHMAAAERNVLVDIPYGAGEIIFLSDPYVVSNGGISLVDNAQLAINIVTAREGLIAFDEYHQGYGSNNNRLFQYFEGTPVVAIFLQCAIIAAFVLFSQSRRFARPIPEKEPDRLSKLEYIGAMAELQQRTRAFDLAIENIYADFRRRVSRLFGVDNTTTKYKELALLISGRIKIDSRPVEDLLFKCEDIIRGEPTNRKETVDLIARLRALEEKLGLQRAGRTKIG